MSATGLKLSGGVGSVSRFHQYLTYDEPVTISIINTQKGIILSKMKLKCSLYSALHII